MSQLNHDAEVAQQGRSETLKDVDAPLRDQVVAKLFATLNDMNIGHKVSEMWAMSTASIVDYLKRQQVYLESIDDHVNREAKGSFSGSSAIHVPVALTICKTYHARFFQALMGVDPPFHVKARNEYSLERTQMVSDTMRYYTADGANYGRGIEATVDRWLWDWITTGQGVTKWRWDTKYTRYMDVQEVKKPKKMHPVEIDGTVIPVPVDGGVSEEEVEVIRKTFEGPVLDLVNHEDLRIIGGGGDPDLADHVLHREYMTASELWTLVDRKVFDKEAVTEVIEGGKAYVTSGLGNEIKNQRALNSGMTRIDGEEKLDRYEIIEAHLKVDVNESGITADVIVWVDARSRQLLRATYLHRVSKSGERPFAKIEFHVRKGQEHPAGLIELVYPLAQEMDAIHNMRIDWGMLSVMPFGFYRASSGIDPTTIQLEPGALIPVDNPQTDVVFPNLGNRTVFGFQEEQALQTMIERLTTVSDMNLGLVGGQGATRTATGSRILSGEMSANLDVYLKRLNRGWKKSLRYLVHMLQQRIPVGLSYRLTGEDGKDYWRTVRDSKDMEGDFDIEVMPNTASSNQQTQIDTASQILQLTQNPLDIQLGIISPNERYEAIKNMLQAMGVKDFGRYLVKVDPAARNNKLTPEEEANRVLAGMDVKVQPGMDHQGFIEFWEYCKGNDEILGQFNENQTMLLERQARVHAQMMQALQAMQAQQANANQMQMNAAQSQQQTAGTAQAAARPPAPVGTAPAGSAAAPQK
jgi:hypothetical protein